MTGNSKQYLDFLYGTLMLHYLILSLYSALADVGDYDVPYLSIYCHLQYVQLFLLLLLFFAFPSVYFSLCLSLAMQPGFLPSKLRPSVFPLPFTCPTNFICLTLWLKPVIILQCPIFLALLHSIFSLFQDIFKSLRQHISNASNLFSTCLFIIQGPDLVIAGNYSYDRKQKAEVITNLPSGLPW